MFEGENVNVGPPLSLPAFTPPLRPLLRLLDSPLMLHILSLTLEGRPTFRPAHVLESSDAVEAASPSPPLRPRASSSGPSGSWPWASWRSAGGRFLDSPSASYVRFRPSFRLEPMMPSLGYKRSSLSFPELLQQLEASKEYASLEPLLALVRKARTCPSSPFQAQ